MNSKLKPILLSPPHFSGEEMKYVENALNQEGLAGRGENLDQFERLLGDYLEINNVVALNSGTAAIHMALILLDVGPDDVVLCSTFTFVASANPIVYQHAKPVFVDSELDTWNMDPILLEEAIQDLAKIGKKPKAVVFVHVYGMPGKIKEIVNICKRYEIPLIEDAAESLGATYEGQKVGTFGDFGVYSFNVNKIISTSGGGVLASNDTGSIEKARFLSTQAREETPYYQHHKIGYNYRMSDVCAGIGRGQIQVLEERIKRRREIYDFYVSVLSEFPGIDFLREDRDTYSNRWLTTMIIHPELAGIDHNILRTQLERQNIETRLLWKPMHLQPVFGNVLIYGNGVSDELFGKGLCLPSGSNMDDSDLKRVADSLRRVFQQVTKV